MQTLVFHCGKMETNEKRIFEKRAGDETASFQNISLGKYLSSNDPAVYEIEFLLKRNSVFDSGKAAWVEPVLFQDAEPRPTPDEKGVEQIRQANRGANVIIMLLDAAGARHFQQIRIRSKYCAEFRCFIARRYFV